MWYFCYYEAILVGYLIKSIFWLINRFSYEVDKWPGGSLCLIKFFSEVNLTNICCCYGHALGHKTLLLSWALIFQNFSKILFWGVFVCHKAYCVCVRAWYLKNWRLELWLNWTHFRAFSSIDLRFVLICEASSFELFTKSFFFAV